MFRDVEADIYIMVDGDDTYPVEAARKLMQAIIDNEADMVIGDRLSNGTYEKENKMAFYNFGNKLVQGLIGLLFKNEIKDIMTGYRVFNRYFVKTMPVMSEGFQIETEISIHALDKKFRLKEVVIEYRDRPNESESKLNRFRDGYRVIMTLIKLFKNYKPLLFFGGLSIISLILGLLVGVPVVIEFALTRFITKVPSAILAVGFIVVSVISIACGLILDTISSNNNKNYELYLNKYKEMQRK